MEPPESDFTNTTPPRFSELQTRAAYGGALAVLALFVLWAGGWLFTLIVVVAGLQAFREWEGLTGAQPPYWKLLGFAYIAIPCTSLIWLREVNFIVKPGAGGWLVLYVLLAVIATDVGAFFAGRKFGRLKLAPHISPNKTWEGLAGGMLAAALIGGISTAFTPFPASLIGCIALGAMLAAVAQLGDLFESWVKRRAGVKDSGTLIPGHGGLLDRIDGYMFAVPVMAWFVWLSEFAV